jgi:hypothetical protein
MAKGYIMKYDKNNNGKLNREESATMCKEIAHTLEDMFISVFPKTH